MQVLAATSNGKELINRRRVLMVWVYLAAIVIATTAMGQKDDPKLKPRPVTLKTKDGLDLNAYYFPSDKGKEARTVLLVHEWQGQSSPYVKLVIALRDAGCAVLAVDYRGHGKSKHYTNARGEKDQFNIAQMSKRDVENIIAFDLEKAKGFLKKENNEGNLNLNALVVVGVGEGCVMAARWAQRDWSFPSVGRMKQGQDVKAMVFISPEKQIKGTGIDPTLTNQALLQLPIMIVAGSDSPEASEAKRIGKRIESMKKRMGRGQASGFDLKLLDTALSGPSLVNDFSVVIPAITNFVKSEVVISDEVNPWIERQ
ncbi:MAG: alpha/beta hydrolase [Rubripirellula sp.]